MGTLAEMKDRIARDIHRTDLTTEIGEAIADAVADYQHVRFAFNQVRATFSTVAGTEFYPAPSIPDDIAEIDSLTVAVNGRSVCLPAWPFGVMEKIQTTTNSRGQPQAWAWYAQQVRLYPIPDAVYVITASYLQRLPVPATSNAWTTEAEQLIRHSAKKRLCRDLLRDFEGAAAAETAESTAFRRLMRESRQLNTGGLVPSM